MCRDWRYNGLNMTNYSVLKMGFKYFPFSCLVPRPSLPHSCYSCHCCSLIPMPTQPHSHANPAPFPCQPTFVPSHPQIILEAAERAIFLHSCTIKSGSGLGTRLMCHPPLCQTHRLPDRQSDKSLDDSSKMSRGGGGDEDLLHRR